MLFNDLNGNKKTIKQVHKYRIKWNSGSLSKFQKSVKDFLRPYWSGHIVFEELPVPSTRMTLDFYNHTLKVAIEVQGEQHNSHSTYFHGRTRAPFLNQLKRDQAKWDFCEKNSITLVEIYPDDIIDEKLFERFGVTL